MSTLNQLNKWNGVNAVLYVDGKPVGMVIEIEMTYRSPAIEYVNSVNRGFVQGRTEIEFVARGIIRDVDVPFGSPLAIPDSSELKLGKKLFRKIRFDQDEP
jgi:hypothetical protein